MRGHLSCPYSYMKLDSMIEVFRTNVRHSVQATMLIDQIHRSFVGCKANFDLSDCDNILRVCSDRQLVPAEDIIALLHRQGFEAEVLPDQIIGFPLSPVGEKVKFYVNRPMQ